MNEATRLPAGFESLEAFAGAWAIAGTANRARRRDESSEAERQAFFEAVKDRAGAALDYLDQKPLGLLDPAEERLMRLMLSFAHIVQAVETQGGDESRHAGFRAAMRITRTPADEPAGGLG